MKSVKAVATAACPHCGKVIQVITRQFLLATAEGKPHEAIPIEPDPLAGMSLQQKAIVELAKRTGLFLQFTECVRQVLDGQTPKNLEKFLVTILKTSTRLTIPRACLEVLRREFGDQLVEYWMAQNIGIVVAGGSIRLFVPSQIVMGGRTRGQGPMRITSKPEPELLEAWMRGKGKPFSLGQRFSFGDLHKQAITCAPAG